MNSYYLLMPIVIPFIVGLFFLFIPKQTKYVKEFLSLTVFIFLFVMCLKVFLSTRVYGNVNLNLGLLGIDLSFVFTLFSGFMLVTMIFFFLLVSIFMLKQPITSLSFSRYKNFYTYLHWSLTASSIILLTNNLVVLLVLWGAVAILLYLLILMGRPSCEQAAYKQLVMVGGSDVLMLIGAALVFYLTGTVTMSAVSIPLNSSLSIIAFILLLVGALTKAGAMPFHTWIVSSAETAPIPVLALFLGVLDKLLGVYLLVRIGLDLFIVLENSAMSIMMMSVGSLTIIAAGSMALMQKNLLKLLAYSTISQVGYIVLGIGTALPIGIVGAIFHMLNNTIYKTSLFFTAGAVERQTGSTDYNKLGGLVKYMPITFITSFIAVLAISGIPPLNGFFSKRILYQAIIQVGMNSRGQGWYFTIFLIAAMFGSVLTLAYFLKVLHSIFFSNRTQTAQPVKIKEVAWTMWLPMAILAILSIGFGVFARVPLQIISGFKFNFLDLSRESYPIFSLSLAVALIIIGILVGFVIYLFTRTHQVKSSRLFIGGEEINDESTAKIGAVSQQETTITGDDFYSSVKDMKLVSEIYRIADKNYFDIFETGKKFFGWLARLGMKIHSGLLQTYLGWIFLGIIAIIAIFFLMLLK